MAYYNPPEPMREREGRQFRLTINLGNVAMQTSNDVAAALHTVASYLRGSGEWDHLGSGMVRDDNGNTVGRWSVEPDIYED
jgi:hypothetical protein